MILTFRDKRTRDFPDGKRVKAFDGIRRSAEMKLDQVDAATSIRDLALPGNRPRTPIHPGEHLAEQLKALDMSAAELARRLAVPTNRVTSIIKGQRAVTGDTALRLGHFFGNSPQFWLNLQSLYELRVAGNRAGAEIESLPTLSAP